MISSETACDAPSSSATSSSPTRNAAAPSPRLASIAERGAARRVSAATTRTRFAEPARTLSAAVRRAVVPARSESPRSAVSTSRRRSSARAMIAAPCFSLKAYDVEANRTPSTEVRSIPLRQSSAAATPMVTASSSQLATAFSGPPGLPPWMTPSGSRSIGMYAPYEVIPTIQVLLENGNLRSGRAYCKLVRQVVVGAGLRAWHLRGEAGDRRTIRGSCARPRPSARADANAALLAAPALLLHALHELLAHRILGGEVLLELLGGQHLLELPLLLLVELAHLAHLDERALRSLDERLHLLGVLPVDLRDPGRLLGAEAEPGRHHRGLRLGALLGGGVLELLHLLRAQRGGDQQDGGRRHGEDGRSKSHRFLPGLWRASTPRAEPGSMQRIAPLDNGPEARLRGRRGCGPQLPDRHRLGQPRRRGLDRGAARRPPLRPARRSRVEPVRGIGQVPGHGDAVRRPARLHGRDRVAAVPAGQHHGRARGDQAARPVP